LAKTNPDTIIIQAKDPHRKEELASAAITPGELLEFVPSGGGADAGQLRAHATAGGFAVPMFALEEGYVGGGIDDDYADGDRVTYGVFTTGDVVYGFLASGEDAGKGEPLESAASGYLRVSQTSNDPTVIGWAYEDKDNSSSPSGPVRIKVEIR